MPSVNPGESERDFVQRCVHVVMHDGSAKDNKQAVAMCYSMFDQHKKKLELSRAAIMLARDDATFRDALILGQGYPLEKDGQPVKYFWKEVLRPGNYKDGAGKPFEISPARISLLLNNFNKAKANGFTPWAPDGHTNDAKRNMGFVLDAKVNDKGGLELFHQIIGDDAIKAVSRNKSSLFTVYDFEDEKGQKYEELILHNAICPDPQISELDDFKPAIAASRGMAVNAVVLQPASTQEPGMDLTKLREALGAGKEIPDEQILTQAVAKLGESKTALELSKGKETELATLKTRAESAERERDEHKGKVLELSKGAPDPVTLEDRRQTAEEVLSTYVERGQCTDAMATIIRENFIGKEGSPGLMLSRGARSGPVGAVFKLLELNKTLDGFRQTESQPVPRNTPGANEKTPTPERIKELRAMAGISS